MLCWHSFDACLLALLSCDRGRLAVFAPQTGGVWDTLIGLQISVLEGKQAVSTQCSRETRVSQLNSDVVDMRPREEGRMGGAYRELGKGGDACFPERVAQHSSALCWRFWYRKKEVRARQSIGPHLNSGDLKGESLS